MTSARDSLPHPPRATAPARGRTLRATLADPEVWAGVAMLITSLLVASPGVLRLVPLLAPYTLWLALLALLLAAMFCVAVLDDGRPRRIAYAAAAVLAWAVVLTTAGGGFIAVLLVMVAALGPYAVPMWSIAGVVLLNTAVVAIVTTRAEETPVGIALSIGFYLLIQTAAVLSSHALLQEQRTRRQLAAAHVALRAATLERAESARTAERLRISRELHDAIGHQLTVLTLQLETAKHVDGAAARAHLERADAIARGLLGDVRATVSSLRATAPDLEHALHELTTGLPGLAVSIDVAPSVRPDETERAALLRAAQEIVTNTIRHADARRLELRVRQGEGSIALTGTDDGRGAAHPVVGNGLHGLRERFAALGGEVQIDGSNGFVVTATVPVR